jgi:hypothetical protein
MFVWKYCKGYGDSKRGRGDRIYQFTPVNKETEKERNRRMEYTSM